MRTYTNKLFIFLVLALLPGATFAANQTLLTTFGSYSPTNENVCSGVTTDIVSSWGTGVFICGGNPAPVYTVTWYYNTTNSVVVGGATQVYQQTNQAAASTYTLPAGNIVVPGTAGTSYYYFVVVTYVSGCGPGNPTAQASTTVPVMNANTAPVGGTATPTSGSVGCAGSTIITLTGYTGSIQWQISSDGGVTWFDVIGGTSPTLATGTIYGTCKYKAKVSCGCPTQSTVFSTIATVTNTGTTTATWLTTGTTAWATASNWSTGVVPTTCTDVTIPSGGTQPTVSTANASCHNLTINAGAILTNSSTTFNIYGNLLNNGNINDAVGYTNLYGTGNTWGGSGTYLQGATQEGWICIKDGANYNLINNLQPILKLGGTSITTATTGSLSYSSFTITVTNVWYCVFFNHFNTGMLNLMGGGSVDVTKSDYGTGVLWVNSSVNNFNFNLEDDYYSVWFNNSAGNTKFGSAALDVFVKQDFWIRSPGTVDFTGAGSNAIVIGHDFINDAGLLSGTATVRMQDFNVQQSQNITSTNGTITVFNGLEIKNSGPGVFLQLNAETNNTATGILTLTSGPLYLNTHKFIVHNPVTTAIVRTNGYVVSETNAATNPSILQWTIGATTGAHIFPFGTAGGSYIPVTFNNSGNSGNISIATRPTSTSDNTPWATGVGNMYDGTVLGDGSVPAVIDRWWDITASVASPVPAVTLSLSYVGAENTLSAPTDILGLQHWNGSVWDNGNNGGSGTYVSTGTPGSAAAGPHTVTAGGTVTYFSPFVLSRITAPLPVNISVLTASYDPSFNVVDINWNTSSETNNNYFTIERSQNGIDFEKVGNNVSGHGTSSQPHDYHFVDEKPYNGISYYRLKQTDFNGNFTYSELRSVNVDTKFNELSVFPNPSNSSAYFNFTSEIDAYASIKIFDAMGNIVFMQPITVSTGGNSITVDVSQFAKGFYFATLTLNGQESQMRKTKFARE